MRNMRNTCEISTCLWQTAFSFAVGKGKMYNAFAGCHVFFHLQGHFIKTERPQPSRTKAFETNMFRIATVDAHCTLRRKIEHYCRLLSHQLQNNTMFPKDAEVKRLLSGSLWLKPNSYLESLF